MPAMTDWSRSSPLSWVRACVCRISASASAVEVVRQRVRTEPGDARHLGRIAHDVDRELLGVRPRSGRSPDPSSRCTRSAIGPLPGLSGVVGSSSRHRSQPARARWMTRCRPSTSRSRNLPWRLDAGDRQPAQRGDRRVVRSSGPRCWRRRPAPRPVPPGARARNAASASTSGSSGIRPILAAVGTFDLVAATYGTVSCSIMSTHDPAPKPRHDLPARHPGRHGRRRLQLAARPQVAQHGGARCGQRRRPRPAARPLAAGRRPHRPAPAGHRRVPRPGVRRRRPWTGTTGPRVELPTTPYRPIPRLDHHQRLDAVRLTTLGAFVQVDWPRTVTTARSASTCWRRSSCGRRRRPGRDDRRSRRRARRRRRPDPPAPRARRPRRDASRSRCPSTSPTPSAASSSITLDPDECRARAAAPTCTVRSSSPSSRRTSSAPTSHATSHHAGRVRRRGPDRRWAQRPPATHGARREGRADLRAA